MVDKEEKNKEIENIDHAIVNCDSKINDIEDDNKSNIEIIHNDIKEQQKSNIITEDISQENIKKDNNSVLSEEKSVDQSKNSLDSINAEHINKLEHELEICKKNRIDTIMRLQAEIENMQRRNKREIENTKKFSLECFFIEFLPVIDNLERALEMYDKNSNSLSSVITGIELTLKSLLEIVYKFGLRVINENNVPFNPDYHQAMTIVDSNEYHPNYVVTIIQKGYLLNNRLIRPAMVTVSRSINK